ncbi:MAG: hypothetical protein ACXAES_01255 [Promethearchaeota archaeon]|jgi:hypothetical protein
MGENEKQPSKEEIEADKKLLQGLYKKEKEERDSYLKSTENERKQAFEESSELISKIIEDKAFMVDRQRKTTAELKELHPDIQGTHD